MLDTQSKVLRTALHHALHHTKTNALLQVTDTKANMLRIAAAKKAGNLGPQYTKPKYKEMKTEEILDERWV
jgi:hypothetical protein